MTETGVRVGSVGCLRLAALVLAASVKVCSISSTCCARLLMPSPSPCCARALTSLRTCCVSLLVFWCLCTESYRLLPISGVFLSHVTSFLNPLAISETERFSPTACANADCERS